MDKNISDQIKYLCKVIPDHEWSGVLFYEVKGSIANPSEFSVYPKQIFLMDKGSAGATDYLFDETLIEYRMNNPETNQYRIGHIHSHNKMATFFSGTDTSELNDNSEFHNYYLSLIVNNAFTNTARIAFRGQRSPMTVSAMDENGNSYQLSTAPGEQVMFYYECDIITETDVLSVTESFKQRASEIITKATQKIQKFLGTSHNNGGIQPGSGFWLNGQWVSTARSYANQTPPTSKSGNEVQRFIDQEFQFNTDLEDQEDEEYQELYSELEDLLVDVMTSYPEIAMELSQTEEELTLVDDVFAYLKGRIGKGKRQDYLKFVMTHLPEKYVERLVGEDYTFEENYNKDVKIMFDIISNYTNEYVTAAYLHGLLFELHQNLEKVNN